MPTDKISTEAEQVLRNLYQERYGETATDENIADVLSDVSPAWGSWSQSENPYQIYEMAARGDVAATVELRRQFELPAFS
jgi:hypothetical protein